MVIKVSFIKQNSTNYDDALLKEANGLDALRRLVDSHAIEELSIPELSLVSKTQLKMTQISSVSPSKEHMALLGKGLAKLHQQRFEQAGYGEDNYIGLNPQKNDWSNNWGKFFVEQRLGFQVELIKNSAVKSSFSSILKEHKNKLEAFLNHTTDFMSLVHGDLWSGNAMFSREAGQPRVWLIDSAVYYGDREVDLAMTEMFGGFSAEFYSAYDAILPRNPEYPTKKVIYNLYHYLNHYNLFGDGYLSACESCFQYIQTL